jgi:hypothetical protein
MLKHEEEDFSMFQANCKLFFRFLDDYFNLFKGPAAKLITEYGSQQSSLGREIHTTRMVSRGSPQSLYQK